MEDIRRFFLGTRDLPSPADILDQKGIEVYQTQGIITLRLNQLKVPFTKPPDILITDVQDTNSMDPAFDKDSTCILIAGADWTEHLKMLNWLATQVPERLGNVVVAQRSNGYQLIHRIVKVGSDNKGRYWKTRGDNCWTSDPDKWRDEDLKWLLLGVIY